MRRIIDTHVHAYPAAVAADPRAWAAARHETWWLECVAPFGKPSIQGWADADRLLRDMDAAGIETAVLLGWYWQHLATCVEQNDWFIAWHRAHPDRIHFFATTNPAAGPAALAEAHRALAAGARGFGELLPPVQGYPYADPTFAALIDLATDAGVPLNLHVTDPTQRPGPGVCPTPLADYVALARAHPAATFILAHLGGGLPFYAATRPTLRDTLRHVYYDTAALPLLYDPTILRRVLDLVGPDRILYGSDYPLRLYPRTQPEPDFAPFLVALNAADLPPAALDALLVGNARRLLKLT